MVPAEAREERVVGDASYSSCPTGIWYLLLATLSCGMP